MNQGLHPLPLKKQLLALACFAAVGLSATTCSIEAWRAGQDHATREQTPAF